MRVYIVPGNCILRHRLDTVAKLCNHDPMKKDNLSVLSPLELVSSPRPKQGNPLLHRALEAQGVTRKGVISELFRIASTGEKVTTEYRKGVEVKKVVTLDPTVQLQAIERLEKLLDRAEGSGSTTRTLTYRED